MIFAITRKGQRLVDLDADTVGHGTRFKYGEVDLIVVHIIVQDRVCGFTAIDFIAWDMQGREYRGSTLLKLP